MSGTLLRIRSERAPYRRAGLLFGEDRFLEVELSTLDEARLLELAKDGSLRLEVFADDKFRPLAFEREDLDFDDLLDAIEEATGTTPRFSGFARQVVDGKPLSELEEQLRATEDRGVQLARQLTEGLQQAEDRATRLASELEAVRGELAAAHSDRTRLGELLAERDATIVQLTAPSEPVEQESQITDEAEATEPAKTKAAKRS